MFDWVLNTPLILKTLSQREFLFGVIFAFVVIAAAVIVAVSLILLYLLYSS